MADAARFAEALRRNAQAFEQLLPQLLETNAGQCAVMRDGSLDKLFDSVGEAVSYAQEAYPDGLYMLRTVAEAA
ncbi:MAG: hypothetical protein MI920_26245 [Kiloniellales bacterium]|nr:hypothetical protein [Kiloniellales bacterium]